MKKFKRTICIVLTIITCFSAFACSGSCTESIVAGCTKFLFVGLGNIKAGREEAEKQQKILDAIPVEVSGYKLKVDLMRELTETDNTWVPLRRGFYGSLNYENKKAKVVTEYDRVDGVYFWKFSLTECVDDEIIYEKSFRVPKIFIQSVYAGLPDFNENRRALHSGVLYCTNGVYFLVEHLTEEWRLGDEKHYVSTKHFPPIFYLIDFENESLFYAGYADNWYEAVKKQDYCGGLTVMDFNIKIEKE